MVGWLQPHGELLDGKEPQTPPTVLSYTAASNLDQAPEHETLLFNSLDVIEQM
jgi:hypothetical protein